MSLLKLKAVFMIFLVITATFVFISRIRPVFAEPPSGKVCCEKTLSDESCVYTYPDQCDPDYHSTSARCEQTSFCQPICCVDTEEGRCAPQVGASQCAEQGGIVNEQDPTCSGVPACRQGCCQISDQCFLATETSCINTASSYPDIDTSNIWASGIQSESACLNVCAQTDQGCCADSSSCSWTTRSQCSTADNEAEGNTGFHKDTFCSDSSLSCGCTAHFKTGCLQGKDEVYWFDSCGNQEDAAQDCDYTEGTLCKETVEGASCASINCESTSFYVDEQQRNKNPSDPRSGGFRANGESWCIYESGTGGFYDRPGSRHYRHLCVNGEELVEPCKDYREEICIQLDLGNSATQFSTASCKNLNEFPKIDLDAYDEAQDANRSLMLPGDLDYDDASKKAISSTTVPPGARFWEGENKDQCEKGTTQCNVVWAKKNAFDDWDCEANCECEAPEFIEKAANYCKMFGDCGADVNIAGKGSGDGLQVEWTGTSNGPHPTTLPFEAYEKWNVYGIFGGMKIMHDQLSGEASDAFAKFLSLGALQAGLGLAATIVAAAFGVGAITGGAEGLFLAIGLSNPVGWVLLAVIALFSIFFKDKMGEFFADLLGAKDKTKTITINCEPWTAPFGGDDCERCGENGEECSEYQCKSLGAACELVNPGTVQQSCTTHNPNDSAPPLIQPWEEALRGGYTISTTGTGYLIQPRIPFWERFTFGIETDEQAQCKWDDVHTSAYDEMRSFFGDSIFATQKNMTASLPGNRDYTYYIRCKDINGNANVNEYTIQFSTTQEPDLTPPVVEKTSIMNGAYMAFNINQTFLWIELNEPASFCWWNKGQDAEFTDVDQTQMFICGNDQDEEEPTNSNRACFTILTDITHGHQADNTYFMRCTDLAGNTMQQGYQFVLKGTTPLSIDLAEPSGTLYTSNTTLQLVTSGGAELGKSVCSYSSVSGYIPFFTTHASSHQQPLHNLQPGAYTYDILCEDIAGNTAQTTLAFTIDVDYSAPSLTSLYALGGNIHFTTDEQSTCTYSTLSLDDALTGIFTGVDRYDHVIPEQPSRSYVSCTDNYNNRATFTIYL